MIPRSLHSTVAIVGMLLALLAEGRLLAREFQTPFQDQQARVYITGHVAHPGIYTLEDGMTVETLVQRAGGFVRQQGRKLIVARVIDGKTTTLVAMLTTPLQNRDTVVAS